MQKVLVKSLAVIGAILIAANLSASAATDLKIQKQTDGVLLTTPSGTLRLHVWSDRIIRVTFVSEENGTGIEESARANQVATYSGKVVVVKPKQFQNDHEE